MVKIKDIDSKRETILFLADAIRRSYKNYAKQYMKCKADFSETSVHDLRVSIRRFLALIRMVNDVIPNRNLKRLRKILQRQVTVFSPLRDTQVQILKMEKWIFTYPVLYTFYNALLKKEKKQIDEIKKHISEFNHELAEPNVFFACNDLKNQSYMYFLQFNQFFEVAYQNYTVVVDRYNQSLNSDMVMIHKTRLAFKKFRYTMERLGPFLGLKNDYYKVLKSFQTLLGTIQDNTVLYDTLLLFIRHQDIIPEEAYTTALENILSERQLLLNDYFSRTNILPTFWKQEFTRKYLKKETSAVTEPKS